MSRNPHPLAGQSTYEGVEAGYEWECIPCLVATRNRVGREMRKAQAEVERLKKALGEQTDNARRWKNKAHDLRKRRSKLLKRLGYAVSEDDSVVGGGQ